MKSKVYLILLLQVLLPCFMFAQNYSFTRVTSCPEPIYSPASFSIGDSMYIVGGVIGNAQTDPKNLTKHVWLYNTTADTWTRMNDFPGVAVYGASAFVINGLGYIANGWDSTGSGSGPDNTWQYNPATDSWTGKAAFPGSTRYACSAFTINNKGYIGMGFKPLLNDFWQYDPGTDAWTQKASFPGVPREAPVSFAIGNYGYAGLGAVGDNHGGFYLQSDFYKYDPTTDSWITLGIFPGSAFTTEYSFILNGEAYVACGSDQNSWNYSIKDESKNVWKYDAGSDTWTLWGLFPDTAIAGGTAGQSSTAGFMGLGTTNSITYPIISAFYRFGPAKGAGNCNASIAALQINNASRNFQAIGNFSPTANIAWDFGDGSGGFGTPLTHNYTAAGTYIVSLTVTDSSNSCNNTVTDTIVISNISTCGVTLGYSHFNQYYTLDAFATGVGPYSYLWSYNNGNNFSTSPDPQVTIPPGDSITYCVVITDSTGCQATACESIVGALDTSVACQTFLYIFPQGSIPGLYYGVVYHTGTSPVETYIWNFGNGVVDSSNTDSIPNYTFGNMGFFDICLTVRDSDGCTSGYCDSAFYAYKVGGGPMNQFEVVPRSTLAAGIPTINGKMQVSVYPNPATDELTIGITDKIDNITIYDELGQVIKREENPVNNKVNTGTFAAGVYFLEVHIGSNSGRVKFIKISQ